MALLRTSWYVIVSNMKNTGGTFEHEVGFGEKREWAAHRIVGSAIR